MIRQQDWKTAAMLAALLGHKHSFLELNANFSMLSFL